MYLAEPRRRIACERGRCLAVPLVSLTVKDAALAISRTYGDVYWRVCDYLCVFEEVTGGWYVYVRFICILEIHSMALDVKTGDARIV